MRRKILLITFVYNPACIDPDAWLTGGPISQRALFAHVDACIESGGLVRVRQRRALLLPIIPDDRPEIDPPTDQHPAHEWAGLTFIPLPPKALARPAKESTDDVPF